jgi:hypothetical protein
LVGSHYRTEFQIPGSDSQRATDLIIRAHFPDRRGDTELLVAPATGRLTGSLISADRRTGRR